MNRGLEISADAADSARSTIVEQVANGVSVRMAVLYLLLSGAPDPLPAEAVPVGTGLPATEPTLQGASA
jgi:aspartate carbamoyltransferase catalytic subunit